MDYISTNILVDKVKPQGRKSWQIL